MTQKKQNDSASGPIEIRPSDERATTRREPGKAKFDDLSDDDFFNEVDEKAIKDEIDTLLARYITQDENERFVSPGAAIMVIKDGEVVYEKYKGAAKGIAKGEGENTYAEISEDSIFDLASVSKQFTAMAIILLKDRGKLGERGYDEPLSTFFSSARSGAVEFPGYIGERVTVRHLLNHTSGLKDIIELFTNKKQPYPRIHHHYPRSKRAYKEREFEPTSRDALKRLAQQDLAFSPDSRWDYSNSGYIILAQIVESVTGEPFPHFMKENIFKPLGMDNTFVRDEKTEIPSNLVTGYDRGWKDFHDIDYTPLNNIYGDGNVYSTLRDMKKWDQALQAIFKPRPGDDPLVKEESIKEALSKKHPTNLHPAIDYTSGWFFGAYRGGNGKSKKLMWHSGGWAGFRTMILRFYNPRRLTVIVLANNMHLPSSTIACRIAKVFLKEPQADSPTRLDLDQLKEVVRNYHHENDIVLQSDGGGIAYSDDITLEDGELYVKDVYLEKYKLVYSAKVSAEVNREKAEARRKEEERRKGIKPPAVGKTEERKKENKPLPDEKTFVFYMEDLDGKVLEGFDIFRYDIQGEKIFTRPTTRSKRAAPVSQRSAISQTRGKV